MLEIQSRPGISPSGLRALSDWADLEEKAASRLLQERLALILINREMGNRRVVEKYLGRKDKFQNPFFMAQPGEVDPLFQSLSNIKKINTAQNMLSGVNDMTAGQESTMVKGPDGKMREVIDMTGKPTTPFESRPRWQQQQAQGQGGLDVLLALKNGGVAPGESLVSRLANYSQAPQDQTQAQFDAGLRSNIELAPIKVEQQQGAIEKYKLSPNRHKQYLDEGTADEMKNTVINAFYDAVKTTSDPNEIRRYYSIAHNALHGLDVAWRRKDTSSILGDLSAYLPGRSGGEGYKTDNVRIYYTDGSSEMGTVPANAGPGFNYRDFLEKNYTKKGLKISRYSIEGSGGPKSPGELAKDTYTVKQAIAKATSLGEAQQIAEEAGFEIVPSDSIKDKILQKLGPLKNFAGYSVVRKGYGSSSSGSGGGGENTAESFIKKNGL